MKFYLKCFLTIVKLEESDAYMLGLASSNKFTSTATLKSCYN
jgi:hypothetical protein